MNDQGRGVEHARGTHDAVLGRVRQLTGRIRDAAGAAEEARTIPREMVDALLGAGISRILIPPRFGGYGLGLDTWFAVVREIGKADASHAWCASLMIHHPHYVSQFPEEAQKAVWADGLDQSIAASIQPLGKIEPARKRIPSLRSISVCQRRQPQPLAHCRRTVRHRRASRRCILSGSAGRIQSGRVLVHVGNARNRKQHRDL